MQFFNVPEVLGIYFEILCNHNEIFIETSSFRSPSLLYVGYWNTNLYNFIMWATENSFWSLLLFLEDIKSKSKEKMSTEKVNDETPNEGKDGKVATNWVVCMYCQRDPCIAEGLNTMLHSMLDLYRGWKTNRQVRFFMYTQSATCIHGPCLGKGVRKSYPSVW